MTALAVAPVEVQSVPWRRLVWVAWRRYRPVLVGLALFLVVLSAYLLITGEHLRSAYSSVAACRPPAKSSECQYQWMTFTNKYGNTGFLGPFLLLLPGFVGAFVGAPLFGRELESGVFRYSWTQGVGRMRLAVALIVPAAVVLVVIMVGLGMLETWHSKPLLDSGIRQRLESSFFPTSGPAVAGWTLAAFTGGVLAGLLWRRVVPALGSCFAIWFGLAYLASTTRYHYLAALTTTRRPGVHDVELGQWWTKDGVRISDAQINTALKAVGGHISDGGMRVHVGSNTGTAVDPIEYLTQHGYQQVIRYQPDSHYWAFQWIELGWLLGLSILMLGATFWLLRRRSV